MDKKNESSLYGKVASNIKYLRFYKGISQEELAACVGISKQTLIYIENPKTSRDPRLNTLEKIAGELGVTLASLFALDLNQTVKEAIAKSLKKYK